MCPVAPNPTPAARQVMVRNTVMGFISLGSLLDPGAPQAPTMIFAPSISEQYCSHGCTFIGWIQASSSGPPPIERVTALVISAHPPTLSSDYCLFLKVIKIVTKLAPPADELEEMHPPEGGRNRINSKS